MCAVYATGCCAHPSTHCCLEINSENSVNFNEGSVITVMWEENQLCICTLCNPEVLGGGLHVFCKDKAEQWGRGEFDTSFILC